MTIYTELNRIQKLLKAPKSQRNSFGKYNYRSCEDILEAVKPLLDDCTLTVSDEIVVIGNRFYVKATACLSLSDTEKVTNTAFAREPAEKKGMDEAQVTGATSSYARKYALNGLLAIDDTKDADAEMPNSPESYKPRSITDEQFEELQNLGADMMNLAKAFKVPSVTHLTYEQAEQAIAKKRGQSHA